MLSLTLYVLIIVDKNQSMCRPNEAGVSIREGFSTFTIIEQVLKSAK